MCEVVIEEVGLSKEIVEKLNKKFIAFDTETTGFNPYKEDYLQARLKDELTYGDYFLLVFLDFHIYFHHFFMGFNIIFLLA